MLVIESYIQQLIASLKDHFGNRLLYVGLQGSYLRGEATDSSDIDIMVILDTLGVCDLDRYRNIIQSLDYADRSCGFICSREDLANWNPLEIWNLENGTKDYFGSLADYVPAYERQDILNFMKVSLNNLYHGLCHSYIHGNLKGNSATLAGHYKSVFFILQNLYYLEYERYVGTKAEMLSLSNGINREVLRCSLELNAGKPVDFDAAFSLLLKWCQETIRLPF